MTIEQYIENINKRYKLGNATEHTFRGDLQQLIESLVQGINATNEPQRQACGAPDYILTKKEIPIGYIEAKDIGDADLDGDKKTGNKEQFDRYKSSLNNIIFTDYINFHLYREGEFVTKITIAELTPKGIKPLPENFSAFTIFIKNFTSYIGQTIKGSKKLAMMMADKAKLLAIIIEKALASDEENQQNSTLKDQLTAFKQILIHDITAKGFADVYAQTIAYGMFAARLHDPSLPTFSRQEAAELIPKSNPFLRKLFGYIAGPDIDDRIKWIVDDLTEIFLACNVEEILANFGKATKTEDPIIHFYETFLSEYDPKLRKARGVWYTPAPVVNFIVRAVDDILKTEFNLPQGLADNSKTKIKVNLQKTDKRYKENTKTIEEEVHRVQILDPAAGTGTFLAEVVKQIYAKFKSQQGIWSNYVETNLLPRLNGFEILMASYAMAHLKLDLLLTETGYKPSPTSSGGAGGGRLRVYLTNSLEESHPATGTLFANWLSTEANEANYIKRDTPVMCVIGNPPYAVSSTNKGDWIQNLIADYKLDLNERKINLDDDYIKFIRYGQYFIDKNGSGVLAYISANSFIDGITHRQMRKHLLESFDKIFILDLHGNAKKNEICPDGSTDQNVFDIMQGVSINVFIKTGEKKKNELGRVFNFDLWGKREVKYEQLNKLTFNNIPWVNLKYDKPYHFFVKKDFDERAKYEKGFDISDLFNLYSVGIETQRDSMCIQFEKSKIEEIVFDFRNLNVDDIRAKYKIDKDGRDWKVETAKNDVKLNGKYCKLFYRPFDLRITYFTGKSKGFMAYPRSEVMSNLFEKDNISMIVCKQQSSFDFQHAFVSKYISDGNSISMQTKERANVFPLYLYPVNENQQTIGESTERTPNLKPEIVKEIAEKLGLTFVNEKTSPTPPKEGLDEYTSNSTEEGLNEYASNSTEEGLDKPGYVTANPLNYTLIKEMRDALKNNPTEAEKVMWEYLRNKKTGHKIRRQHIIDDFITDFVCLNKKVVIEIDGKIHLQQKEYDELRTAKLNELEYQVIRFTNDEVIANPESVTFKIKEFLDSKANIENEKTSPTPPKEGLEKPDSASLKQGDVFAPIDILDYIYAVLHSPSYREKYKEFLKIDFPRVPYPKDKKTFWKLVKLGGELREIHLLESPQVEKFKTKYPVDGSNIVDKPRFTPSPAGKAGLGSVYINSSQYFESVPEAAWNFYIGGYQPAQKWLKDRKGRKLEFDDIQHYQKIIVALSETDRLMGEIDKVGVE